MVRTTSFNKGLSLVLLGVLGCSAEPSGRVSPRDDRYGEGYQDGYVDRYLAYQEITKQMPAPRAVEFYVEKLHDKDFRWTGPAANTQIIPVLHAARALACIGDPAVPALLEAIGDPSVDIESVILALDEIGLPVWDYEEQIRRRDASGIARWWRENAHRTVKERSRRRIFIGLPPIEEAGSTGDR